MFKEVDGRWGRVRFLGRDEYVGRSLYNYGEYNPDETEKIISLAAGRCLDIGANMGVITQALLRSGFAVDAFEPQPEIFNILSKNCEYAGGKYAVYNTAVGATGGTAEMPKVSYSEKGNFGGLGIGDRGLYGTISVPVIAIDSFGYDDVGFMKIDVEGYEYEVLMGATKTIERCRPVLYIEDDRAAKSARLRETVKSLGYTIEEHKPRLYREQNFFGLKKNIWDRNFASHNIICTPC